MGLKKRHRAIPPREKINSSFSKKRTPLQQLYLVVRHIVDLKVKWPTSMISLSVWICQLYRKNWEHFTNLGNVHGQDVGIYRDVTENRLADSRIIGIAKERRWVGLARCHLATSTSGCYWKFCLQWNSFWHKFLHEEFKLAMQFVDDLLRLFNLYLMVPWYIWEYLLALSFTRFKDLVFFTNVR
jgi:hypothetical protein